MSDLDKQLTELFHDHADTLGSGPLSFDDVRGKATSIRRRRRIASGLAVAAAVAVVVPTALVASRGLNSDGPLPATQVPTAKDSASPEPTTDPTPGPTDAALDVSGLPTGAEPQVEVVTNGDLALARTSQATVTWTQDGIVVRTDGRTFGPYPASQAPAVNDARTAVAWATDSGDVMVWSDGSQRPYVAAHPDLLGLDVAAVTGTDCTQGTSDCTLFVSGSKQGAADPASITVAADGSTAPLAGGIIKVNDATEDGRVLGYTRIGEGDSCSAVVDVDGGKVFGTCDHTLDAFSPTGEYVLASDAFHSGDGNGTLAVYSADGTLLTSYLKKNERLATWTEATWEDDTHVLVVVRQGLEWSVVRLGVDGSLETAVAPVEVKDPYAGAPFHLELR